MVTWKIPIADKQIVLDELAKYNVAVEELQEPNMTSSFGMTERVDELRISDPTLRGAIRIEKLKEHIQFIEDAVSGLWPLEQEIIRHKYMSGTAWPSDEWVRKKLKVGRKRYDEAHQTALWSLKCELNTRYTNAG